MRVIVGFMVEEKSVVLNVNSIPKLVSFSTRRRIANVVARCAQEIT
jgi:hypothetical protein